MPSDDREEAGARRFSGPCGGAGFIEAREAPFPVPTGCRVRPMEGGGSARRYFRVFGEGPFGEDTYVVMTGPDKDENLKFCLYGKAFRKAGLPVPLVAPLDFCEGAFLVDDLGDARLDLMLGRGEDCSGHYARAAEALADFHERALGAISGLEVTPNPPYTGEFMIREELGYFLKGLGLLGIPIRDLEKIAREGEVLAGLVDEPLWGREALIHRDFQSSNLMVRGGSTYILDWQGARRGPFLYDLASLLWDPYAGLSEGLKGEIALAYLRRARLGCSLEELFARLLPFGAARLLQAFGAYAKLSAADGKLSFKRFLPVAAERLSKIFEEGALSSFTALRGLADELSGRLGGGAWRL